MPLAVRLCADRRLDQPFGRDAHVGEFLGRTTARHLYIITNAPPVAQPARGGDGAARGEARPVRLVQRAVEQARKIADIEHEAKAVVVRQLGGGEQIAPPHLVDADAKFARCRLDQPLHDVRALGPSRAAIRVHRRGVGDHPMHAVVDRGDAIHPAYDAPTRPRLDRRAELGLIRAQIAPGLDLQSQYAPFAVCGQRGIGHHVAPVRVRLERIAALACPLDRPAQCPRGLDHKRIFGIDEPLHPEAAAHILRHQPQHLGRDAQHARERFAHAGHALAAHVQSRAPVVARLGHRRAHFHRCRRHPVLHDP